MTIQRSIRVWVEVSLHVMFAFEFRSVRVIKSDECDIALLKDH